MPDELPEDLPPRRRVDHAIEVMPGVEPPTKAPYRMSHEELKELKVQLEELLTKGVATPLWPSVGVKPNTWKSWELESSGTPECSELDSKGKNTPHGGVLGVVGKFLKRRYLKCPRIGNSDICSPSYGQKKGRESNWQFDSRPLKVGNRPFPDVRFECATWRWKDLNEGYNIGSDLVAIQLCSREL